ncbi:hypothetical protein DASB73_042740 [Starmerella bacillaris]|uniref:EVE domain-containing protein n=1 Tax=Starmerella bacillaris TaxID=1247836 RepID=A0AAV5RP65_STABA|nr:hypothetical protein DASB73_042740 [Starmerella bacillaris]
MRWLVKAEPNSRIVNGHDVKYTIDDLQKNKIVTYGRIRNYEARKYMKQMTIGDKVFFYRSNCKEPAITGIATVVKEAYPDKVAMDPSSAFYDPKKRPWFVADLGYESHLAKPVLLSDIKKHPELSDMLLVKRCRLSVLPVQDKEWETILDMSQ